MPSKKSSVNKILVISLTNIGDVILTLPVIDVLKRDYPSVEISIIIGPKAASLFEGAQGYKRVYVYDKHQPVGTTLKYVWELRKESFDLVVDLKNSALPFLIAAKRKTPAAKMKKEDIHMRDKHLKRLSAVHSFAQLPNEQQALPIPEEDKIYVRGLIHREIGAQQKFVVIAPGSAYHLKRWPAENFARLAERIAKTFSMAVILAGDQSDNEVADSIAKLMRLPSHNFTGRTSLIQLAQLIKSSELVISNDSAPMHLASYFNKPTLALFGPSDPRKYGPWGNVSHYLKAASGDIAAISAESAFDCLKYDGTSFSFKASNNNEAIGQQKNSSK